MSSGLNEYNHAENALAAGETIKQVSATATKTVSIQRPRSLQRAVAQLETEAMLAGERFFYGWGEGKNRIEGPSVKLAIAAARCYGNCEVKAEPVDETPTGFVFTHIFIDHETGFAMPRQFLQSKAHIVHGKHDEARKMDIRFQIGQSKNIRNVILNGVPAILIEKAMEAAKSGVRKNLLDWIAREESKNPGKGLEKCREVVLASLLKLGIDEKRVLFKLEIAGVQAIGIDQMIVLKGDIEAIKGGEATAADLFPIPTPPTVDGIKAKMAANRSKGKGRGAEAEEPAAANLAEGEIPNEPTGDREPGDDDLTSE